ncbi:unnamed protein product [Soboliphyme baturini]|uniref:Uncharacterized protein n=1 Tax=Soboliphyme baturini TaxID=241478 RepID=A0A183JAP2_9BILA|nr:unnamed protein product [Soboliphyme baturini]
MKGLSTLDWYLSILPREDAVSESYSESMDDVSLESMETPRSRLNSNSFALINGSLMTCSAADADRLSKLRMIQKTRPKPPRKNPRSVVVLAPVSAWSDSNVIDYTLGVDSFFESNVESNRY